ncbi:hypothetical protein V5O48_004780 [Marasmius crinis-equi]|uniref:Uncharacterized protein n=1 Tax=Marasmius crinis-equi TaxID=585013 RepID=A0ABR3FPM4_9AGAR
MSQPFYFPPDLHGPPSAPHRPAHHASPMPPTSLPPFASLASSDRGSQVSGTQQANPASDHAISRPMDGVPDTERGFVGEDEGSMMGNSGSDDEDQVVEDDRLMGQNADNAIEDTNATAPENPRPKTPTLPAQRDEAGDDALIAVGIAELAKELGLAEWQHNRLTKIAMTPFQLGEDASLSMVLMQVMSTASYFDCFNRSKKEDKELAGFQAVLSEMRVVLDKSFKIDQNQKTDIRGWLRYKIWDPYRLDHREGLVDSVVNHIIKNAGVLNYSHVVGIPHRLTLLRTAVQEQAKTVRNGFRTDIRNSCDAEKVIDVEAFLKKFEKKYIYPGCKAYKEEAVVWKIMMVRRFVVDNPDMVWANEEEPDSTRPAGGGSRGGSCFWSAFDANLATKVAAMGKNIWAASWVDFRKELVQFDQNKFPGRLAAGVAKKRKRTVDTQGDNANKAPRVDGNGGEVASSPLVQTSQANVIPHLAQTAQQSTGFVGNAGNRAAFFGTVLSTTT